MMAQAALSALDPSIQLMLLMASLTLLPFLLSCMTSFMRYVIVLSILKQALGTQQVPPSVILVGLALLMTLYTMNPVFGEIGQAITPLLQGNSKASVVDILTVSTDPLKRFMLKQTRQDDVKVFLDIQHKAMPNNPMKLNLWEVAPAFMLSELRTAFEIGFVIFVPFVILDLVVSNILMAMGMMMLSPTIISLPFKILIFVAVDGWSLIVRGLVQSFQ